MHDISAKQRGIVKKMVSSKHLSCLRIWVQWINDDNILDKIGMVSMVKAWEMEVVHANFVGTMNMLYLICLIL